MAQTALDTAAARQMALLLTFAWGAGLAHVTRYCRWADDLVLGADTFTAVAEIEATIEQQNGGADDCPVKVMMPILSPLDALTSQVSHAPVWCTIEELDPADAATRRAIYKGVVTQSRRNPAGATGLVEIELGGWRRRLNVRLGMVAASTCPWTFGDAFCQKDVTALYQSATVASVDGQQITLNSVGWTHDGSVAWAFGEVYLDGLALGIRMVDGSDPLTLHLVRPAPASWAGQTVRLTPGCDKTLETCRDTYANEERFCGFGLKMPRTNPLYELPG